MTASLRVNKLPQTAHTLQTNEQQSTNSLFPNEVIILHAEPTKHNSKTTNRTKHENNPEASSNKALHITNNKHYPVSILYKSIAGCYRPVRVADGLKTARYRLIENASWVLEPQGLNREEVKRTVLGWGGVGGVKYWMSLVCPVFVAVDIETI